MATFSAPAGAFASASLSVSRPRIHSDEPVRQGADDDHDRGVLERIDEHAVGDRGGNHEDDVDDVNAPAHISPLCWRGRWAAHHAPASARKKYADDGAPVPATNRAVPVASSTSVLMQADVARSRSAAQQMATNIPSPRAAPTWGPVDRVSKTSEVPSSAARWAARTRWIARVQLQDGSTTDPTKTCAYTRLARRPLHPCHVVARPQLGFGRRPAASRDASSYAEGCPPDQRGTDRSAAVRVGQRPVEVRTDSVRRRYVRGLVLGARQASGSLSRHGGGLDNGKPGVSRGRKATGLARTGTISQPGYRKDSPMKYWDGHRWIPERPASPSSRVAASGAACSARPPRQPLSRFSCSDSSREPRLPPRGGNGGNPNRAVAHVPGRRERRQHAPACQPTKSSTSWSPRPAIWGWVLGFTVGG